MIKESIPVRDRRNSIIINPAPPSCSILSIAWAHLYGSIQRKTREPSSGGMGIRLKTINPRFIEINMYRMFDIAAAKALANCVPADKLDEEFIIPNPLDKSVAEKIAKAVSKAVKTN